MSCNKSSLFFCITEMYCSLSSMLLVSANKLEKPTIALRGVRISWLMLAKKADFKRSASSAFSLAAMSLLSVSFSSVMSRFSPMSSIMPFCGLYSFTLKRIRIQRQLSSNWIRTCPENDCSSPSMTFWKNAARHWRSSG